MPPVRVTFVKCIHDSQDFGSDYEYIGSRVFFNIDIREQNFPGFHVDVRQRVGTELDEAAIYVGEPRGASYQGPWDAPAFNALVKSYYRGLFTPAPGDGLGLAVVTRIPDRTFLEEMRGEFEAAGPDISW